MAITLRDTTSNNTGKGSELTHAEMDTNLESYYYSSSLDGSTINLFTTGSITHSIALAGAAGAQGADGTPGVDGAQGAPGNAAAQGDPGIQGAQGADGPAGAQGADGTPGVNGAQGAPGNAAAQGDPGPEGAQGAPGSNGAQGDPGTAGAQGAEGAQGAPSNVAGPQGAPGAGGGITVDNNVNNYMLTATGGSTINGEANATFTPASGFGSQHWLDIKNGGLSLDNGLISYGYLSNSALPSGQDTTIMTISAATYAAIFIDYQIAAFGSTAQRSGAFMAHWNSAGTVSFANYSTVDIGAISEANTLLRAVDQSPNIEIYWNGPSIISANNHGYVATYRLLKRMTIVDGAQQGLGGVGGA